MTRTIAFCYSPDMPQTTEERQRAYLAGVLDAGALLYVSDPRNPILAVSTRDESVKRLLVSVTRGGTVEPGRWVLKSSSKILGILGWWLAATESDARKQQIKLALYDLEHLDT